MAACELVTAIALATTHARPVTKVRRLCLAALIRQAARENAIIVDFPRKRIILPPQRGGTELLEVVR